MILSDGDIKDRIENGDLEIEPIEDPDMQFQPASVDLRLGNEFVVYKLPHVACIDTADDTTTEGYTETVTVDDDEGFILHPGEFVLGSTREWVRIPDDLVARVEGRSSIGRLAVVVHASLPADEEVFLWTPDEGFGFWEIGEVVDREIPAKAVSFDPETLEVRTCEITDFIENHVQQIFRVTLENGRSVHVTKDHNLFTLNDEGEIEKVASREAVGRLVMTPDRLPAPERAQNDIDLVDLLEEDDRIVAHAPGGFDEVDWSTVDPTTRKHYEGRETAPLARIGSDSLGDDVELSFKQSNYRVPRRLKISEEFGWLLGFYAAEGYARRKQIMLTNTNPQFLDRAATWFQRRDASVSWNRVDDGADQLTVCSALWSAVFQQLAGAGRDKSIPEVAWNWSDSLLDALLEGLLDGDGHRRDGRATLYTANEELADRATYLGTRLGYLTSTYRRDRPGEAEDSEPRVEWALDFREDAHKRGQYVPNPSAHLRQLRQQAGLSQQEAAEAIDRSSKTSISNIENREYESVKRRTLTDLRDCYAEHGADTSRLDELLDGGVRFERVADVEQTERIEPTYDLEVRPEGRVIENFLGGFGGVFLSNTAGFIDPGFEGRITLELSNLGRVGVKLYPGMRISQLVFQQMTSPAERPYGPDRGSKYFGQEGPVVSRIGDDEN